MSDADVHSAAMLVRKLESNAEFSQDMRQALLRLPIRTQVLEADQDIAREGDTPSQACLILEGWACRYKLLDEGRRQILSFHIPGDIPDLQSLHIHTMDHSLATLTQATVAFIPHGSLLDLTARFPSLAAVLWRETLVDAALFRERIASIGRRSALERIAHLLCEIYVKLEVVGLARDHRCNLALTQMDIADALGLTAVHVNRVLQDLRRRGIIRFKGRSLSIEIWDDLVSISGFKPNYLHLRPQSG